MRFELIDTEDRLRALAPPWQTLLARAERPEPMLSPDWIIAWWEQYSKGRSLAVGAFSRGDELVGLACLCRRRYQYRGGLSFKRLEIMGCSGGEPDGACGEYLGLLAAQREEEEVASAFVEALKTDAFGTWDELVLELMDAGGATTKALEAQLPALGHYSCSIDMQAYYVPLPANWEAYLKSLHGKRRNWFRRTWKGFEAWVGAGGFALHRARTPEEVAQGMWILADLHSQRWRAGGMDGAFASPRFSTFHENLAQKWLERGQLDLLWLEVGGEPVAAHYGFIAGGKVYFYQSGRGMSAPPNVRIGIVMFILAIQDAMLRGLTEYDFLGGDSPYKTYFTSNTRPLITLRVARKGWRETALRGLRSIKRRLESLSPTEGLIEKAQKKGRPRALPKFRCSTHRTGSGES